MANNQYRMLFAVLLITFWFQRQIRYPYSLPKAVKDYNPSKNHTLLLSFSCLGVLEQAFLSTKGVVSVTLLVIKKNRHKYLKRRIPYHTNSTATFNYLLIRSGDVQTNPRTNGDKRDSEEDGSLSTPKGILDTT